MVVGGGRWVSGYLAQLCLYLLQQGYDPSRITVLTTYSGQWDGARLLWLVVGGWWLVVVGG